MSTNYKIQMHHYNGTDYDNLFPISTSATSVFAGVTTPEEHGASNDGSADATNGIQDALNSGKIVIFDGIYRVDNTITLPSNAYLIGQNCKLIPAYDSNGIVKTMFSGTSVENVIFENLNFEGTYTGSTPTINDNAFSHSLIEISGGDSVTFKDCTFTNIDGVLCQQYDDATAAQSFWKQNGDIITLRGVTNSLIHNCTLNHACANSAIWILPALSSSSLDGFNATVDGLNVIGINDSNPPLNVLCESATIKNVYYDEDCNGVVDGSAMYLFALNLNVDNINCLGTYATIISCDGLGKFQNDNVNISNVNVVCQSAMAITCVAKSCNIVNLTGSMNSAVVVNNIVDSDLSATFFPWKYSTLGKPTINITNINIHVYNGDHAVFMLNGSPSIENGQFNIDNSYIDIQTVNTTYQPFTIYGGSLIIDNCKIIGDCAVIAVGSLDVAQGITNNVGEYIRYYGGISSNTISSVTNDKVIISNCIFKEKTSGKNNMLCVINGCLSNLNICNNILTDIGSDGAYLVAGNYATNLTIKDNQYKLNRIYAARPMFRIAACYYYADFPVAFGSKRSGDLVVISDSVKYNHEDVNGYYRYTNASGNKILQVGDTILDTYDVYGFAQCLYIVVWGSGNTTSTGQFASSTTPGEESNTPFGNIRVATANTCITVCINNVPYVYKENVTFIANTSAPDSYINGKYMGYSTN